MSLKLRNLLLARTSCINCLASSSVSASASTFPSVGISVLGMGGICVGGTSVGENGDGEIAMAETVEGGTRPGVDGS